MPSLKHTVVAVILASLVGCTTVPTVEQAAALDIGTTAVALYTVGGEELNPMGFWGTTLLKLAYIQGYIIERTPENDRTAASLWTGAAANNMVQLVFSPHIAVSMFVGIVAGRWVYTHTNLSKK